MEWEVVKALYLAPLFVLIAYFACTDRYEADDFDPELVRIEKRLNQGIKKRNSGRVEKDGAAQPLKEVELSESQAAFKSFISN